MIQADTEVDFRESNPNSDDDCQCFISIVDIQTVLPVNPVIWTFFQDNMTSPDFYVWGQATSWWRDISGGFGVILPTPYYELNPSNHPIYNFGYSQSGWGNPTLTIVTNIKCYVKQLDESLELATSSSHSFRFDEGSYNGTYSEFCRELSCNGLIPENGGCDIPNVPKN